jgi:pimeloyl-ACP methyl ester carboxylesterase
MLLRLFSAATALYLRGLGARRRRLEEGPISLVYYEMGPRDGEPWLLLHGLGGIATTWDPVLRALRRECRLIAPELSSLGGTRAPGGGLDVEQGARMAARLVETALGGRPVTVAGLSLGGWMAVRLALTRPELVSRLLLIDAGGYREQDWDRIKPLVAVEDLDGIERLYEALFVRVPWLMDRTRRGFLAAYRSPGVRSVLARLHEKDTYTDADLARIHQPTSVIWGERDGIFRLEPARAMAAALPNAELTILPDCGHAVHMECPDRLVAAVREFRRKSAGAAGAVQSPKTLEVKEWRPRNT